MKSQHSILPTKKMRLKKLEGGALGAPPPSSFFNLIFFVGKMESCDFMTF